MKTNGGYQFGRVNRVKWCIGDQEQEANRHLTNVFNQLYFTMVISYVLKNQSLMDFFECNANTHHENLQ